MAMPHEEAIGIVGCCQSRALDLNNALLAGGDYEAIWPGFCWPNERERVYVAIALAGEGGIECRWLVGCLEPSADGRITRGREDGVGGRK